MCRLLLAVGVVIGLTTATDARAQGRVEKNVIYGMYSGLALLMDIHYPAQPNGYGIVFVSGSGWQAPLTYGAVGLKEAQIPLWGPPLLREGYTVFAINHRAAPRFHYPTAVEDVQRAVRFVRHHGRQFGIEPNRLGAVAGSSGAHLIGHVSEGRLLVVAYTERDGGPESSMRARRQARNESTMSPQPNSDEMRPEYDFSGECVANTTRPTEQEPTWFFSIQTWPKCLPIRRP